MHKLLDEEKSNEYEKIIHEIQSDNQWQDKILYSVIDTEMSDDKCLLAYMTDYNGYYLLLQGFGIDDLIMQSRIVQECAYPNEGKRANDEIILNKKGAINI